MYINYLIAEHQTSLIAFDPKQPSVSSKQQNCKISKETVNGFGQNLLGA